MAETERRRRGRPTITSREEILSEAARFDLRNLSVRALARRLRMSDAAIHYRFGSRDQLMRALADHLTAGLKLPPPTRDWRGWLRRFAVAVQAQLRSHPGAAEYLLSAGPTGPRQMQVIERALGVLTRAGIDLQRAWMIYATMVNYVIRSVHAEERFGADGADPMKRIALEAEASSAPDFAKMVRSTMADSRDVAFRFGLEALLRGIRAHG